MRRLRTHAVRLIAGVLALAVPLSAGWAVDRHALGRDVKLRVLVDKVIMAHNKWVMTEEHVKEIAEAGFNVVSPRLGNDDMDEVRKIARAAADNGIFHVPWMRGTLACPPDTEHKLVWASGIVQDLYSPNSDEFWQWTNDLILEYARISVDYPALIGVFLDYENYAPNPGGGNCYELSYDYKILNEFGASRGIEIPQLPPSERHSWLMDKGLFPAFEAFQVNHWRERCRTLRQAVDAINPDFQFIVYPAPGTKFIIEAIYPEWTTEQAPLILADPYIYGRAMPFLPHAEALEGNRDILTRHRDFAAARSKPLIYMGGIDPVVRGADPEFSGRNAVMSAYETDGYWIFYEGPTYDQQDHRDYWRWFSRANRAIDRGQWSFQYRERETLEPSASILTPQTNLPQVAVFDGRVIMRNMISDTGNFEVHEFSSVDQDYLNHFDAIILQNFNYEFPRSHPISIALRNYVEQGGGLMLAHDTAWFMESPFPEVAVRDYPKFNVEAIRHVIYTNLRILEEHEAVGSLKVGTEFETEFYDHMIFKAGPQGTTIIENTFGDPVYVIGEVGKGRVAFLGSYYGYKNELEGAEREAFLSVLKWLAGTR